MRYIEFVKRIVPFVATFAIGMLIASLFLGLTGQATSKTSNSFKSVEKYETYKLRKENYRLRRENNCLKWKKKMRDRREARENQELINLVPPVVIEKR
jgi:hypothetical protein